jgi:hypothetical protein
MNLFEYADIIQRELEFCRASTLNLKWSCRFKNSSIAIDNQTYISIFGYGDTIEEAIEEYCKKIQGKNMYISGEKFDRHDYTVPEVLM